MSIVDFRRDLHQHPEVGFTEFWTASVVVEKLQEFGYKVLYGEEAIDDKSRRGIPPKEELDHAYSRALKDGANPKILEKMTGGLTGVVGILEGKTPGPTIAFRVDMDALPIEESTDNDHLPYTEGFRSKYEGNMHACAHDGHTAIGIFFAEAMAKRDFAGTLKLIFQPAEEGGRGGYAMVKKGVVDDVDKIYCLHLGLDAQLGEIYGGSTGRLATSKLRAHFHGVGSHAGVSPEKGRNALLGAATALLNIHALPRYSDGRTRVNVGILEGGTGTNIIPYYAKMAVETRATTEETNKDLESRVRTIIANSAAMHGLTYEIELTGQATTMPADNELVATVMEEAKKIDGFHSVQEIFESGGSEDASFLVKRVQELGGKGTYMIIGTTIPAPHHNERFDIDERVLPMSVQLLEKIAVRELV